MSDNIDAVQKFVDGEVAEPSPDSPDGHHTWSANVMLTELEAKALMQVEKIFQILGHVFNNDPRVPVCLISNLERFIPKKGVILPPEMEKASHVFVFALKLKTQLEKELAKAMSENKVVGS